MMIYLAFARAKDDSFVFFLDVFPDTSVFTLGGFAMGFETFSLWFLLYENGGGREWKAKERGAILQVARSNSITSGCAKIDQNVGELSTVESEEWWLMKGSSRSEGTGSSACNNSLST